MDDATEVADYTERAASPVSPVERAPTRAEMSELLESVAATAYSVKGRMKAVADVVRVLRHCPWIAGALRVEVERSDDGATTITVLDEHAGGRERALPPVRLDASFDELGAVIRSTPSLFAPLRMYAGAGDDDNAIVLYTPA